MPTKVVEKYFIKTEKVGIPIHIVNYGGYTYLYKVIVPNISSATTALMENIKDDLLKQVKIGMEEIFDPSKIQKLIHEFQEKTDEMMEERIPSIPEKTKNYLSFSLVSEMLGLGMVEILLIDDNLEEIVINSAKDPTWVYHKKYGWLRSNIFIRSEKQIQNYASIISRRVGRQITTLDPLLDAHLISGDRANATLFPVSTKGNTLSIRKFARKPWTVTDFIKSGTMTPELCALLWMAIQYELNMVVAGGTSAGKTALLNTLMPFIQPNHRIISIEDTRELKLPDFLHWVPLTTRLPNPEGKGEITMLDLMINSLRMRPDRIVVGEIRRSAQAEVLFEAMHTGHSVYATLHADTAEQALRRLTNPPISIPNVLLEALDLIVVQHRDRRRGIRRVYQLAELMPIYRGDNISIKPNIVYRSLPDGTITPVNQSKRIFNVLNMHTGITRKEMNHELQNKVKVLKWMVQYNINTVNEVGRIISEYYTNKEDVLGAIQKNKKPESIIRDR